MKTDKPSINVIVTRSGQFRARIDVPNEPPYEVTVGGVMWKLGKGKEYKDAILARCLLITQRLIATLMIEATKNPGLVTLPEKHNCLTCSVQGSTTQKCCRECVDFSNWCPSLEVTPSISGPIPEDGNEKSIPKNDSTAIFP
jgi:hypothetical protein